MNTTVVFNGLFIAFSVFNQNLEIKFCIIVNLLLYKELCIIIRSIRFIKYVKIMIIIIINYQQNTIFLFFAFITRMYARLLQNSWNPCKTNREGIIYQMDSPLWMISLLCCHVSIKTLRAFSVKQSAQNENKECEKTKSFPGFAV